MGLHQTKKFLHQNGRMGGNIRKQEAEMEKLQFEASLGKT
jgi:hypothetical protein